MAKLDDELNGDSPIQIGTMEMWIDKKSHIPESNVLVTVSDLAGEHSYLVTGGKIVKTKSSLFVQAQRSVSSLAHARGTAKQLFSRVGLDMFWYLSYFPSRYSHFRAPSRLV